MILRIFFDGAVKSKSKVAWVVLAYADRALVGGRRGEERADCPTGNLAEYRAFLEAIKLARRLLILNPRSIKFLSDSLLVVNQTKGIWKVDQGGQYLSMARSAWKNFSDLTAEIATEIHWLSRRENPAGKIMKRDWRASPNITTIPLDHELGVS